MKISARTLLLGLAAVPVSALFWATVLLLPRSRDVTGDLRELVAVAEDGGLTFAGTGVGTPSSPADPHMLGTLPRIDTIRGDFGTTFFVMGEARDGRVRDVKLFYDANPVAATRLFARWREVFERAGADCVFTGRCILDETRPDGLAGRIRATLDLELSWYGPSGVTVVLRSS